MPTLTTTERTVLERFKKHLHELYPGRAAEVRLFGSKARGEGTPESDIDLLVVLSSADWRDERAIVGLASTLFLETGIPLSPKVYTEDQVTDMRRRRNVFLQSVERDAVPV